MNCYFHPAIEGVVTCGKCGVAMCRECEQTAFYRMDNGTGRALCNRCSLTSVQENVNFKKSFLVKRLIKVVICTILVGAGLLCLNEDLWITVFFWAISGVVIKIGNKFEEGSVKDQVKNAAFEYDHPLLSFLIGILVNAVLAPVMLIFYFIGYIRTWIGYKRNVEELNAIRSMIDA